MIEPTMRHQLKLLLYERERCQKECRMIRLGLRRTSKERYALSKKIYKGMAEQVDEALDEFIKQYCE